ncbi:metallo-beta-lactamase superfamily protein [Sarocladium implicatum]|nr:metallo-beta-lactamase superfamily protein [Sarocladium implicatum]
MPTVAQFGSPGHTNFSDFLPVAEFPNAQQENLTRIFSEAEKIVRQDLAYDFTYRCLWTRGTLYPIGATIGGDYFMKPRRVFDDLYFIGYASVSAWAIDTGDGLIVIDSLYNEDEIERILIPGLQTFGFEMSDVKALLITHEHIDHYGGAGYIQKEYGTPIYASEQCWDVMADIEGTPTRDKTIGDSEDLKVGKYALTAYHTPGHSDGCLSLMIPVTDNGTPHLAALYGGGGVPAGAENKALQMKSFARFADLAKKKKADALVSNHATQDQSLLKLEILDARSCKDDHAGHHKPGPGGKKDKVKCSTGNPYVVGTDYYVRYLQAMSLCVEMVAARNGEDLHY